MVDSVASEVLQNVEHLSLMRLFRLEYIAPPFCVFSARPGFVCSPGDSGFGGPWTPNPNQFDNEFYTEMLNGNRQWSALQQNNRPNGNWQWCDFHGLFWRPIKGTSALGMSQVVLRCLQNSTLRTICVPRFVHIVIVWV